MFDAPGCIFAGTASNGGDETAAGGAEKASKVEYCSRQKPPVPGGF